MIDWSKFKIFADDNSNVVKIEKIVFNRREKVGKGENVPWVTLFKNCSLNFDLSINMALVNGGFLHHMDMKKFLKNLLLCNCWSDFEISSWECSLGDPFQKVFPKF